MRGRPKDAAFLNYPLSRSGQKFCRHFTLNFEAAIMDPKTRFSTLICLSLSFSLLSTRNIPSPSNENFVFSTGKRFATLDEAGLGYKREGEGWAKRTKSKFLPFLYHVKHVTLSTDESEESCSSRTKGFSYSCLVSTHSFFTGSDRFAFLFVSPYLS